MGQTVNNSSRSYFLHNGWQTWLSTPLIHLHIAKSLAHLFRHDQNPGCSIWYPGERIQWNRLAPGTYYDSILHILNMLYVHHWNRIVHCHQIIWNIPTGSITRNVNSSLDGLRLLETHLKHKNHNLKGTNYRAILIRRQSSRQILLKRTMLLWEKCMSIEPDPHKLERFSLIILLVSETRVKCPLKDIAYTWHKEILISTVGWGHQSQQKISCIRILLRDHQSYHFVLIFYSRKQCLKNTDTKYPNCIGSLQ